MEVDQRQRRNPKREPLSDRTNFNSTTLHPTSNKKNKKKKTNKPLLLLHPATRIPRQPPKVENSSSVKDDDDSTGSNVPPSPHTVSTPPPPPQKPLVADSVTFDSENSGVLTVYHRRPSVDRSKDKGKQVMEIVPFSCPPAGRIRNIGDVLITEQGDITKLKKGRNDAFHFNTNPHAKNKKRCLFSRSEQHTLPQDFIDKQRAYFAEVDAFELLEEEASENEMEELNRAINAVPTDSANQ